MRTLPDKHLVFVGSAVEAAARRHMQPGVSLTDEQAAFPPAHHFNPFRSLHADREGLLPETPIYGAESTAHHLQAASASPLQSGAAGSVFASEPSTPTGAPAEIAVSAHDNVLDRARYSCAQPEVNAFAIDSLLQAHIPLQAIMSPTAEHWGPHLVCL